MIEMTGMRALLAELAQRDITIRVEGSNLAVRAGQEGLPQELKSQIVRHKDQLLQLLAPEETIHPVEAAASYPLSNAQRRLWVLSQLGEASGAYHMPGVYEFAGTLEVEALREAFRLAVQRHSVLRTRFVMEQGEPRQVVEAEIAFGLTEEDWRGVGEEEIGQAVQTDVKRGFELEKGPVWRSKVMRVGEAKWVLVFVMHHIAGDGWSVGVLMRDLLELYRALKVGEEARLPMLEIQYKDYAAWQNRWLEKSEKAKKSREYWHEKLGGELPVLELPLDYTRSAQKGYEGGICRFELGCEEAEGLKKLARQKQTTLFVVMVGLVKVLLHRYSGQEDIVVGAPVAGRDHVQLKDQVGFYVNTLALRDEVRGEESFVELLAKVKQTVLEGYEHQYYPFDALVDELEVSRDLSRHPIFEVMVVQAESWGELEMAGVQARVLKTEEKRSKFDLTVHYGEHDGVLEVELAYDRALFGAGRMQRMGEHLRVLARSIVSGPEVAVGRLEIMAPWEKKKVLEEFNATAVDYPLDKTVVDLFEEQVGKVPGAVALVYGEEEMSYAELNRRANQLGRVLRDQYGVGPGQIVGIVCERSFEMVIGIIGIMKAGGAYLPIDPEYPEERKVFMLEDSDSRVVVGQSQCLSWVTGDYKKVDLCLQELSGSDSSNLERVADPENLAYVIYTSGSTGKPKGVMITRRSFASYVFWAATAYRESESVSFPLFTSLGFDLTVTSIFLPLCTGGTIQIHAATDLLETLRHIAESTEIGLIKLTPAHLELLLGMNFVPGSVHSLILGGENLPTKLAQAAKKTFGPQLRIFNEYGPTECTVGCMIHSFDVDHSGDRFVSIGRPSGNARIYVLDRMGQPVPLGVVGEIHIGGDAVGKGYLRQPELTASQYLPDPFVAGGRMYRSGDEGRLSDEGRLECLGRMDNQVKVRGYRIELGEIEASLGRMEGVKNVVVVTHGEGVEKELCGYYVGPVSERDLKAALRKELPEYMVPGRLIALPQLPLTASGKVNRKALPKPEGVCEGEEYSAPANEVEAMLVDIWENVLRRKQVSTSDSFFALGGHSINAMEIISRVSSKTGVLLSIRQVFTNPSLQELAKEIQKILATRKNGLPLEQNDDIAPAPEQESYPLSFGQQGFWYLEQAQIGANTYSITGTVELRGALDVKTLRIAFEKVIEKHESLRSVIKLVGSEPRQFVKKTFSSDFTFDRVDGTRSEVLKERIAQFTSRGFDFEKDFLIRALLLETEKEIHFLTVAIHHIAADGWSLGILTSDLTRAYEELIEGRVEPLDPLPIQYKDYSVWERACFAKEDFRLSRDYWMDKLRGIKPLTLTTDRPRPSRKTLSGGTYRHRIGKEKFRNFKELAKECKTSLFASLTALVKVLLYQNGKSKDIAIGTPTLGRDNHLLKEQIGFYVNTLVLRDEILEEVTLKDFVVACRDTLFEAIKHGKYPYSQLVQDLKVKHDPSRNVLFDVVVMMNPEWTVPHCKRLDIAPVHTGAGVCRYDLKINFSEIEEALLVEVDYALDLFEESRIRSMIEHLEQLVEGSLKYAENSIGDLPVSKYSQIHSFENGLALPSLELAPLATAATVSARELTPSENSLAGIWTEILETTDLSPDSNFFDAGGSSLMAIRMMFAVKQQLNVEVELADILRYPTLEALAKFIENELGECHSASTNVRPGPTSNSPSIIKLNDSGSDLAPLFLIHPIGGTVFCYNTLAMELNDRPVFGVQSIGERRRGGGYQCLGEMADDYIDQMQRIAPRFMVAGWSFGGMVAYEIARKLRAKRQLIGAPVLIDAPIGPIEKPRDNDSSLLKAYLRDLAGLFGKRKEFDVLVSGAEMTEAELLDVSNTLQIVQISERKAIQEMVEVYRENARLAHDFRYLSYDGKLIYCANARINDKSLLTLPSDIQWNNVEVIQMSGGHYEMLSGENLLRIKAAIERAS